jgi:L-Ala-D/L-Glu epimerase
MQLSWFPFLLQFKHPFGVSSNTRTHTPVVFTKIQFENFFGYGEAAVPPYLGETQQSVVTFLVEAKKIIAEVNPSHSIDEIIQRIDLIATGNNAAKASIDIALHDLYAKIQNKPLYEFLGLKKPQAIITSCTIGLGDEKLTETKIIEAKDFQVLKIKLGSENDKQVITQIRKFTNKPLYVDVNQGWKDVTFVIEMIHWLKENNVVLVEQPMPLNCIDQMKLVKEKSALPLFADENVKRLGDIALITDSFHGINIKLMKSTGISEAIKMIHAAKESGLKIYLGCMGESSCAASAMHHLTSLADYVDLDAPFLINNDPFERLKYDAGTILLPQKPGIGVEFNNENFWG